MKCAEDIDYFQHLLAPGVPVPQKQRDHVLWLVSVGHEALLPLCQSKSCLRCCTIVETSSTTNPQQQIEVMELQHYGRRTCSKQPCRVDRRVFNKLDRRRVLLTTRSTCRGEILKSRVLGRRSEGKCPYFWRNTQCRYTKLQCQNPARFVQSFLYNINLYSPRNGSNTKTQRYKITNIK